MADERKDDEHIEELLSQLQGIFGKLSTTDTEEARAKADLPAPAPAPEPTAVPAPTSAAESAPVPTPAPAPAPAPAPIPMTDPFALKPPTPLPPPPEEPQLKEPLPVPTGPVTAATPTPVMPEPITPPVFDNSTIGCAVYYPMMRDKEAKTLAQKIETMTPKFTKVAFKLNVAFVVSYDQRGDWRDPMIARVRENNIRALFLLSDRPMDDARRRGLQAELEASQIYFQEVPLASVEKKAFFTDVLLGMVFFFDSMKPKPSGE